MIPRVAVTTYLEAQKANHHGLKKLTRAQVDGLLAKAAPDYADWYAQLGLHQKVAIYCGLRYPRFAFWLDMGAGKTLVSLELLRYWYVQGKVRKALIFVISDKAFPTWEKQIKRFDIGLPYVTLEGSSEQKWATLATLEQGLVLLTYPGAMHMVTRKVRGKNGKSKQMVIPSLVSKLGAGVGALVLDESTRCSGKSLTYEFCDYLSRSVDICYALSGRPFGRDPTLLFRQQYIVDRGATFGKTLGLFRAAFFEEKDNPWSGWPDYVFRKDMMPALTTMSYHRSISYTADECVDLPARSKLMEILHLPEEAGAYYSRVVKNIIEAKGNYSAMKNAFVRMRQLSSGFLGMRDEETGERAEVAFNERPKLDRLLELIEDLPTDRQAVVFYEFTYSGRLIHETLSAQGKSNIWLWSGTKDYRAELDRFMSGSAQIAVINHKVGGFSLDGLQCANYLFVYESPVSCIDREQMERRILRQGQLHRVFQYDLVVRGTMDERILQAHKEGADLFQQLVADPESLLGAAAESG
jgi:hypothetical protein